MSVEIGEPVGWWSRWHMNRVAMMMTFMLIFRLINWFLDPYFKYKNRKQVKDYESFFNKITSKEELGTPYLLRPKMNDFVGLGLVVPAYNE